MKLRTVTGLLFAVIAVAYFDERFIGAERGALEARLKELDRVQFTTREHSPIVSMGHTVATDKRRLPKEHDISIAPMRDEKSDAGITMSSLTTPEKLAQYFENNFHAQAVDSDWASQANKDIRAAIDASLPEKSSVISFECRSNLCRLEVEHAGIDDHNKLLDQLTARPDSTVNMLSGGMHAQLVEQLPEGRLRYGVFIVRRGIPLYPE
jgi:hypothetical protein